MFDNSQSPEMEIDELGNYLAKTFVFTEKDTVSEEFAVIKSWEKIHQDIQSFLNAS